MLSFNIKSSKIVMSDPCYDLGIWCQRVERNVRNGVWNVFIKYDEKHVTRVASLMVINAEAYASDYSIVDKLNNIGEAGVLDVCGVDSGSFGFFDFDSYRNDSYITDDIELFEYIDIIKPGDKFYSACRRQTIGVSSFGVFPFGVVSSSGWGDGSYAVRGIKNDLGEFVGFKVMFIDDYKYDDDMDDADEFDDENID